MNVISATYTTTDPLDQDFHLSVLPVGNLVTSLIPNFSSNEGSAKKQNVRKELLNQLYQIYLEACNKEYYVKNKKRYYAYIKRKNPEAIASVESYKLHKDVFRKAKLPEHQRFLKPIASKDYLWWHRFSHLKGEEGNECLRLMISDVKDMINRKKEVIPFILGACGKLS